MGWGWGGRGMGMGLGWGRDRDEMGWEGDGRRRMGWSGMGGDGRRGVWGRMGTKWDGMGGGRDGMGWDATGWDEVGLGWGWMGWGWMGRPLPIPDGTGQPKLRRRCVWGTWRRLRDAEPPLRGRSAPRNARSDGNPETNPRGWGGGGGGGGDGAAPTPRERNGFGGGETMTERPHSAGSASGFTWRPECGNTRRERGATCGAERCCGAGGGRGEPPPPPVCV